MPTFNKVDMMNCAAGHHDFSDDASECHVCGFADAEASWPATAPETLAVLKEAQRMVGAYALALERGSNATDASHVLYVERQIAEVIARTDANAPQDDGWTAAELQRIRDRANNMECLIAQAIEAWPQFDCEDEVNGGDLVEWFGQWRAKAKALLDV